MTGRLRKSVTIGACLVFIVMNRRADFYKWSVLLHWHGLKLELYLYARSISIFLFLNSYPVGAKITQVHKLSVQAEL